MKKKRYEALLKELIWFYSIMDSGVQERSVENAINVVKLYIKDLELDAKSH